MIEVIIDNFARLRLEHPVCDFNGTLAQDGRLIEAWPHASASFPSRSRSTLSLSTRMALPRERAASTDVADPQSTGIPRALETSAGETGAAWLPHDCRT